MSRPVRVAFLIDRLVPGAGTENQLLLVLQHIGRFGVAPRLLVLDDGATTPPVRDSGGRPVPMTALGVERLLSPAGLLAAARAGRALRSDGVRTLVTFFRDAALFGALAGLLSGVRVIGSRRNVGYWQTRRELWLSRLADLAVDRSIANSDAARAHAIRAERIVPSRIDVVPNAIDTTRFRPAGPGERLAAESELGLPPCPARAVCVANLRPVKAHGVLLEAFAVARRTVPDARLVLVGDGSERPELEARAVALGVADALDWLGARGDVELVLRAADVGVLASRSESSSNTVLEYMACALPVVATDVGGTRELVAPAAAGRLVAAGDAAALGRALGEALRDVDAGEARRTGRRARAHVLRTHAVDPVVARWASLLGGSTANDGLPVAA